MKIFLFLLSYFIYNLKGIDIKQNEYKNKFLNLIRLSSKLNKKSYLNQFEFKFPKFILGKMKIKNFLGLDVYDHQDRPRGHLLLRFKDINHLEYETYEGETGEFFIENQHTLGNCKILMPPHQSTEYTKFVYELQEQPQVDTFIQENQFEIQNISFAQPKIFPTVDKVNGFFYLQFEKFYREEMQIKTIPFDVSNLQFIPKFMYKETDELINKDQEYAVGIVKFAPCVQSQNIDFQIKRLTYDEFHGSQGVQMKEDFDKINPELEFIKISTDKDSDIKLSDNIDKE